MNDRLSQSLLATHNVTIQYNTIQYNTKLRSHKQLLFSCLRRLKTLSKGGRRVCGKGTTQYSWERTGLLLSALLSQLLMTACSAPVLGSESSRANSLRGTKVPGSEKARERKFQGAKVPGSESSRERIGQCPIGRFAPGSELARERKGCES